jgi:glucose-1-phosphate cytidylyltransferase
MKVVILCGGQGSRIRDVSEVIPKPMLPIGGKPVLWHIMKIFAAQAFSEFVLALGYKGWTIKEFFLNYLPMTSDCTITLGRHSKVECHDDIDEGNWKVTLADTGENTMTGGRVWRIRKYVEHDDCFMLTYGDGLADIDLKGLLQQHYASGLVGTISAVRVEGRFGELQGEDGRVTVFQEKPAVSAGRINGGYMVFDSKRVWEYFDDSEDLVLERTPLERMVRDGQLGYYEHNGYWQCMDTMREYLLLNSQWEKGKAPWKIW